MLKIKRIYDPAAPGDGQRIYIDRLWPRGMKKEEAKMDEWLKGTGKKTAKIMFVSDQPSKIEYTQDRWMIGHAGDTLRHSLDMLDLDIANDCYFTGIVKFPTPEDRPPLRDELEISQQYFNAELQVINPDIIVPMGNVALKQILGYTGITKYRGKAVEKDGRLIFPIVHPSLVYRQPVHLKKFVKDLQNLRLLLDEGNDFLEKSEVNYRYLEDLDEIKAECERLEESEWVVFDIETTGLNPFLPTSKIVCISLTDKDHSGVTIPIAHRDLGFSQDIIQKIVGFIKKLLENPKPKKMAYNGKFDMKWLNFIYGINVANFAFDPFLAHYLAVTEERGNATLKDLAWEHTDMGGYDNELDAYTAKLPESERHNYDNVPWDILKTYASGDVDCTMRVFNKLEPILRANGKWGWIFDNLLIEGSYMLRDVETNGAMLDLKTLEEYEQVYPQHIKNIEEKLRQYPEVVQIEREKLELFKLRQLEMKKPKAERDGEILKYNKYKNFKFNFGSPAQLRELLFVKLGLTTPFLTDTGEKHKKLKNELTIDDLSTGKETLGYLEDKHPIANLLSEWRKLDKLYGTYIAPARSWIGIDGLIHPIYNLTGTVTGRLSSEAPNAQNFPRKSNDPFAFQYSYGIKKLFKSRFGENGIILQFDYSQLELRVCAMFSSDPELTKAYNEGKDMHIFAASQVLGIPEEEVTDDQRTAAKAVNFGLIYGKGKWSLAEDMHMTVDEAGAFIDKYFEKFAGVKKWLDDTKDFVTKNKYVESLTGRWRRLPGVDSHESGIQGKCFREATNAPIQSSGSDMTLLSLIKINAEFRKRGLRSVIAITVHDSIVADVFIPEFEEVFWIMKNTMEHLPYEWITVPIVAEAEIGRDYGTLVDLGSPEDLKEYDNIFDFVDKKWQAKHEKLLKKAQEKKQVA
jgi:uracil-DNA glycosylase family 4